MDESEMERGKKDKCKTNIVKTKKTPRMVVYYNTTCQ